MMARQLLRSLLHGVLDALLEILTSHLAQQVRLGNEDRCKAILVCEDTDLPHLGDGLQGTLHGFRIHVLAAGEHDHGGLATVQAQVAIRVDLPRVPGAEPAILVEDVFGLLRQIQVARKDVWPPGHHLAAPVRGFGVAAHRDDRRLILRHRTGRKEFVDGLSTHTGTLKCQRLLDWQGFLPAV
jgi:hypothetical protein